MMQIAVLASGAGTNFAAVMDAVKTGELPARVTTLITDRRDTGAAAIARENALSVIEIEYAAYSARKAFEGALRDALRALKPDLILALGFMRIIPPEIISDFPMRILNVHPSLLPAFPGMNAQKQAIDYGAKVSGVTVHFMDAGVDSGPIVLQESALIPQGATPESLRALLRPLEHRLVIQAAKLFVSNRIRIDRRIVTITGNEVEDP